MIARPLCQRRRAALSLALALALAAAPSAGAQTRRARAPATRTETPEMTCPSPLGTGVRTGRSFCDVVTGRDPADGILITLPPHRGAVTLTFDLHNRQTYSEEQVRAHRAYARYTAVVGVLTMDNTLISRAVVRSEFRTVADLVDRIGGGAGPSGLRAVAPTGTESIVVTIPQREEKVSILGEKLVAERQDGTATYSSAGRPIALVSNVKIEYRPAPQPRRRRR